jgi:hypothetical protein
MAKAKLPRLKFIPGWSGGHWELDGTCIEVEIVKTVIIKGVEYRVKLFKETGVDHDHGQRSEWTVNDPRICVTVDPIPTFLSLKEKKMPTIYVSGLSG